MRLDPAGTPPVIAGSSTRPTARAKVSDRWMYLYRADQSGQVIDVLACEKRDRAATRRFFTRALEHAPQRNLNAAPTAGFVRPLAGNATEPFTLRFDVDLATMVYFRVASQHRARGVSPSAGWWFGRR